jgi:hypothetical protein
MPRHRRRDPIFRYPARLANGVEAVRFVTPHYGQIFQYQ